MIFYLLLLTHIQILCMKRLQTKCYDSLKKQKTTKTKSCIVEQCNRLKFNSSKFCLKHKLKYEKKNKIQEYIYHMKMMNNKNTININFFQFKNLFNNIIFSKDYDKKLEIFFLIDNSKIYLTLTVDDCYSEMFMKITKDCYNYILIINCSIHENLINMSELQLKFIKDLSGIVDDSSYNNWIII